MARLKQEINSKSPERLKRICEDLHITQKRLSEATGISENTLSKIATGRGPLTRQIAEEIIKICPSYRIEWLLGYDDFETVDDYISSIIGGQTEVQSIIERLMVWHGYRLITEEVAPNLDLMSAEEVQEYERKPYFENRHAIRDANGNIRFWEIEEQIEVFQMIDDFVEFMCSRAVQRPFSDYLHTRKGVD